MVRIAPVRLEFNPKTLWFDALDLELHAGDAVVVSTARGAEFGHLADAVFEMDYEETKKLKSPLKSVKRLATDEDAQRAEEIGRKSMEALPLFRRMAKEAAPDMSPVAVEYLFEGDKAVFYFESEERIDFRDLVHRLASELHVRVDMKQVGSRDGARMVGGLGHCGQELCCRRLGGEFNPVSIRMAKEQDLSLNPQKISGVCGRLMCCLRYEYDAYKEFHGRAPKKNAKIETPDGEGKVVSLDVPREIISIQVGTDKPVKVPLSDMDVPEGAQRPTSVGQDAWEAATAPAAFAAIEMSSLFAAELTGQDKLADRSAVHHLHDDQPADTSSKRKRRRRRRSTTVDSGGDAGKGAPKRTDSKVEGGSAKKTSGSVKQGTKAAGSGKSRSGQQQRQNATRKKQSQVGRNSSALRSGRNDGAPAAEKAPAAADTPVQHRRRRRTHKAGDSTGQASAQGSERTER